MGWKIFLPSPILLAQEQPHLLLAMSTVLSTTRSGISFVIGCTRDTSATNVFYTENGDGLSEGSDIYSCVVVMK